MLVAMQYVILTTFLVIQYKLDGNTGVVGPFGVRWCRPLANQITGVIRVHLLVPK